MRSPILATIAALTALVGYAVSERAHALQAIEGPRWWDEGLTREQAASQAVRTDASPTVRETLHELYPETRPGLPGHDLHLIGLALLVAGGTVAVAAVAGER